MNVGGLILRLGLRLVVIFVVVPVRRVIRGRKHPEWSLRTELFVEMMQLMTSNETEDPLPVVRKRIDTVSARSRPVRGAVAEPISDIAGMTGEWLQPLKGGAGTLLYFHGGGYVVCSTHTHRQLMSGIAVAAGCRVLGVNYRLAPEDPFPAAIEDGYAAYRWLLDDQGLDPADIMIAGDSAGGGLTVATLLEIRKQGAPMPAGAVLLSPWLDMTCSGSSIKSYAAFDYLPEDAIREYAQAYVGDTDPRDPQASPVFAELGGLPPLLVHAGGVEVLRSEIEQFCTNARGAGVDVQLDIWPGMVHVWHAFPLMIPQARPATDQIAGFIRRQLDSDRQVPAATG